jgi:uncharacterized damage-inducible protein DinB
MQTVNQQVFQAIAAVTPEHFEAAIGDKWSVGQHLDHLIRSVRPLNMLFSFSIILRWFGTANRPSRSYEELVTKYQAALAKGGRAMGQFIPRKVNAAEKDRLLETYKKQHDKLIQKSAKWSEKDLDKFIIPHPLIGRLTVREMMFFTVYHNEHHLKIISGSK